MIKGKFGDAVRAKTETGQINEVLCKVLCHNLCMLVQANYELGVELVFWADSALAQERRPWRSFWAKPGTDASAIYG